MKTIVRQNLLLLAGATILALAAYGLRLRGDRETVRLEGRLLQDHVAALIDRVEALETQSRALTAALGVQSNRADEAVAELARETATHDPLRRQIEKMLAAEIDLNAQLKRQAEDVAAARAAAAGEADKLKKLTTEQSALQARLQEAEKSRDAAAETQKQTQAKLAELQQQLESAKTSAASAENGLAEERKKTAALTAQLDALRKKADELAAQMKAAPAPKP